MEIVSLTSVLIAIAGALFSIFAFFLGSRIKSNERLKHFVTYALAGGVLIFVVLSATNYYLLSSGTEAPGNVSATPPKEFIPDTPSTPKVINTTRPLEVTLSDHNSILGKTTRSYTREFKATPGFKITDAKFVQHSATRVSDFNLQISNDGCVVLVRFSLTSGPQVDRYRGWLKGEIQLTEQEIPNNSMQPTACSGG